MDRFRRILIICAILAVIAVIAYFILPVSVPLILALLTAMAFDPLIRLLMRRLSMKRSWAVLSTFLLFVAALGGISYAFISKGISQAVLIAEQIPSYTVRLLRQWEIWSENIMAASEELPISLVNEISAQLDGMLLTVTEPLRTYNYLDLATSIGTWIPLFLVSVLVYLIAVFLFMLEMPSLREGIYNHLKAETAEKIRFMSNRLAEVMRGFIKAQFLVSLVIFSVSLIALLFISPEVAFVMALVIWFIDFIPILGSIVIVGPWALLELIFGDVFTSVCLAVLAVILLIIRRTLEPKVMGQYIGLSPLATLISIFLGIQLIGLVGFIVGPLVLIAFRTAKEAGMIKLDFKL